MEKKETDNLSVHLKDLLDIPAFQNLVERFTALTGIAAAILDLSGNILIAGKWQRICTEFHRKHPETAARCRESDTILASALKEGEKYNAYNCRNGLIDVAVPIVIDNVHLGNLFAGQFFTEPPDMEQFARQAEMFGYDSRQYLDTLATVPILSREQMEQAIGFLTDLTAIIAHNGLDKKRRLELNQQLEQRVENRTAKLKAEIRHRLQTELKLQRRVEFEQVASGISSALAGASDSSIDRAIDQALKKIGAFTDADRAYIFQFKNDKQVDNTHEWCADGIEPQIEQLKGIFLDKELPWFAGIIRKRGTCHVPDVSSLPPEARLEKIHFESQKILSLIVIPMQTADKLTGFLGFDSVRKPRVWDSDDQNILRFISETIGVAMERYRTGKALHESEMRWQFALEGAGDGIWDWDIPLNRVFFSPRCQTMLGYNEENVDNTLEEWDSRIHPDDKVVVHTKLDRHLKGETPLYQNEYRLRCKDGSYKWILGRGKITRWTEDGKPARMIGTNTDISDRKHSEAEREQLITELQEALSEVKQLSGLLPICSFCKKIRDDKGYWKQIETYIKDHSQAEFSHSVCQDCAKKYYPGFFKEKEDSPPPEGSAGSSGS